MATTLPRSGGSTRHIWDGQNAIDERDSSNVIQVAYTLEPLLYGNLISQRRSGASSYYLFDALGSTDTMTVANQSIVNTYKYRAFGETTVTGLGNNSLAFVGRLGYMGSSGLLTYYARARWYEPSTAVWLSQDPLGFGGGD